MFKNEPGKNAMEAQAYKPNKPYPVQKPLSDEVEDYPRKRTKSSENVNNILFATSPEGDDDEEHLIKPHSKLSSLKDLELDGFSSLAEATSWCARIFWFLFLLCVLAFLTFEIYKTFDGYINQPVVTTYTITKNSTMKFPDLYVCPGNFINETVLKLRPREAKAALAFQNNLFSQSDSKKPKSLRKRSIGDFENGPNDFQGQIEKDQYAWREEMIRLLDSNDEFSENDVDPNNFIANEIYSPHFERFRRDVTATNQTSGNGTRAQATNQIATSSNGSRAQVTNGSSVAAQVPMKNLTVSEVYDFLFEIGFDSKQVFLECRFTTNNSDMVIPCSELVEDILDVNYGKCFKLSVGDRVQTMEASGLSLIINTLNSQNSKAEGAVKRYKGLFISVEDGLNPASWEKVLIGGGVYLNMDISVEHLQLLNLESGDVVQPCVDNDKASLQIFNVTYSLTLCQLDCFMAEILQQCNCILMTDKKNIKSDLLKNHEFCSQSAGIECIRPRVTDNDESNARLDQCKKKCHIPCDSWRYRMMPTTMALNPAAFTRFSPIPYTDILQLDVSFSRLEYTEFIQAFQITLDTFIGNLGGQITLWIGGSMITLINIPILISTYCLRKSVKKAKSRLTFQQENMEKSVLGFQNVISSQAHKTTP